jgi:hypothetical protein
MQREEQLDVPTMVRRKAMHLGRPGRRWSAGLVTKLQYECQGRVVRWLW